MVRRRLRLLPWDGQRVVLLFCLHNPARAGPPCPLPTASFETFIATQAEPACCSTRAVIVPIIGYTVDIGLPVVLLIASYLFLR